MEKSADHKPQILGGRQDGKCFCLRDPSKNRKSLREKGQGHQEQLSGDAGAAGGPGEAQPLKEVPWGAVLCYSRCLMTYLPERHLSKGRQHSSDLHRKKTPHSEPLKEKDAMTLGDRGEMPSSRGKQEAGRGQPATRGALLEGQARSPGRSGLGEAQRSSSRPPCHLEAALHFSLPAIWVAKSNSSWSSFFPHRSFFFRKFLFFPPPFFFETPQNDQSSGSLGKRNWKTGGKCMKEIYKQEGRALQTLGSIFKQ